LLSLETAAKSVPGSTHPYEDRILVDERKRLFAVADGVTISSQGSGGIAAEVAIELLQKAPIEDLVEAITRIHETVLNRKRMGDGTIGETTLTAAVIEGTTLELANVGDSPAYLVRNRSMKRLTHSDKSESGYITQVIGFPETIDVHLTKTQLRVGDFVIIISDGVLHVMNSPPFFGLVTREPSANELASKMIAEAQLRVGSYDDDKSVIVVKVLSNDFVTYSHGARAIG
jgi:protein phosphatase